MKNTRNTWLCLEGFVVLIWIIHVSETVHRWWSIILLKHIYLHTLNQTCDSLPVHISFLLCEVVVMHSLDIYFLLFMFASYFTLFLGCFHACIFPDSTPFAPRACLHIWWSVKAIFKPSHSLIPSPVENGGLGLPSTELWRGCYLLFVVYVEKHDWFN